MVKRHNSLLQLNAIRDAQKHTLSWKLYPFIINHFPSLLKFNCNTYIELIAVHCFSLSCTHHDNIIVMICKQFCHLKITLWQFCSRHTDFLNLNTWGQIDYETVSLAPSWWVTKIKKKDTWCINYKQYQEIDQYLISVVNFRHRVR